MKGWLIFIGLFAGVSLFIGLLHMNDGSFLYPEGMKTFLKNRLVKVVPANEIFSGASRDSNGIIYVLGGSQRSLESRFIKASALYRDGAAGRVLIMSRRGITEYNPMLGRNLTNDEWAVDRLMDLGVPKSDIELVSIPESFWGTFHEARAISELTLKRGHRYLLLVSSLYHTRRVWDSFSKMLQGRNVSLYVYPSEDPSKLKDLVIEYVKLLTYDNLLLPLSG
ncbi:MAG TPA: ElyC/SanA/YdcF family protein [Nitrospiria bacterium]|nr:ElyC/SanA/YdcF family protein [Nitrospiria bacterium]